MLPLSPTSRTFEADQVYGFTVDFWDTPFATLEGDVASGGIVMDLREPMADGTFTVKALIDAVGASSSALSAFNTSTASKSVVADGRVANLIGFWSGGAPGQHGASVRGRLAYHWRCYLRTPTGRAWFSNAANPTFSIAFAGNGYFRIDKVVGGAVTNLFKAEVTETELRGDGNVNFKYTPLISNMANGDYLDIYYVQDGPLWGGFAFKAVLGSTQTNALASAAPVLGCGLFDDDTARTGALAKKTLTSIVGVEVQQTLGGAAQAGIDVALINPTVNDGVGWEYVRSGDTPGFLRLNEPTAVDVDVKRQRLIRITGGYANETQVLFTGFVDDFDAIESTTRIRCVGFEQRVLDQYMKNYPDLASYLAFPNAGTVYGIPAYDNWPLEYVLRDLLVRAGIDESKISKNLTVPKADGTSSTVTYGSQTYGKFRGRTMSGNLLPLERPVHYGNAGVYFNEAIPVDDEYIFKPENTQELWNRCRELTDRYGYDFRFDALGDAWLQPRNIPHYALDVTGGGGTVKLGPSAYAGNYREYTGTVSLFTTSVTAARIDLALPRAPSLGSWTYTVKRASDSAVMATGTLNPDSGAGGPTQYFYDFRASGDGLNPTVVTLYSGYYDAYNVELSSSGGSGGTVRRLDCFLLYHTDPLKPLYPVSFATDLNAFKVAASTTMEDMRNHAIVVGRRTAAVTDSSKLETNPSNPESEFVVERAVDVRSITDPTAPNFIGYPKEALIYDASIVDQDVAAYLAATFVYRYRMPKPSARVEHTLVPVLQLRDPVYVVDAGFKTVDAQYTLFVHAFTHRIADGRAQTTLETTSYPEFPSYEPREDMDVDSNFGGNPVQNVEVQYTSLDSAVGNIKVVSNIGDQTGMGTPTVQEAGTAVVNVTKSKTAGSPPYLDCAGEAWPPVPGTLQIKAAAGVPTTNVSRDSGYGSYIGRGFDYPRWVEVICPRATEAGPTQVRVWASGSHGGRHADITDTPTGDPGGYTSMAEAWYYEWNPATRTCKIIHNHYWDGLPDVTSNVWNAQVWFDQVTEGYHDEWVTNNPYHHFMNVDYKDANRRIYLPWKEGDKSSLYAQLSSVTSFQVRYVPLGSDPYSGKSPFYDPYTSELGHLVQTSFDALISGFYRVSVCSAADDTVVAWLTEPASSGDDPEAHWQYFTAGAGKRFFWDGVDQRGEWNIKQSVDYASSAVGVFEQDQRPIIGKGFYVWNEERRGGAEGPRAIISAQRGDAADNGEYSGLSGIPEFGHGTYAKWYVKIENLDPSATTRVVRTVRSDNPDFNGPENNPLKPKDTGTSTASTSSTITDSSKTWTTNAWIGFKVLITSGTHVGKRGTITANTGTQLTFAPALGSSVGTGVTFEIQSRQALVFTHLSEPTKVEIKEVLDFANTNEAAVGGFDEASPDAGVWNATPDAEATINNDQPVKIRFTVQSRPGSLWDTYQGEAEVKLTRLVHLKATIFDQFIRFAGVNFPGAGQTVENRTVVSRRLMDDGHTVRFEDSGYRKAKTFQQTNGEAGKTQWVFLPRHFKKDFRGVPDEVLQFGDYLQLQEVPGWDDARSLAGPRARFLISFINYLFYLSAYTQDRSGRMVWCLNRKFLDKSKILENVVGDWWDPDSVTSPPAAANATTYRTAWPDDMLTQHRRTIICRQWADELAAPTTTWVAAQAARFGFGAGSLGERLLRHKWSDHESTATNLNGTAWPTADLDEHSKSTRTETSELPAAYDNLLRQLGATGTTRLNNWTWEGNGSGDHWIPCVTRDFHPYFMLPPMCDALSMPANVYHAGHPLDTAGADLWNSPVWDMTQSIASGKKRFWRGMTVEPGVGPTSTVNANTMNYLRQDDLVHYEDLRGAFSRGPKPGEQPKKVVPVSPYYVNPYRYDKIRFQRALNNSAYPLYLTGVTPASNRGWFDMSFRSEYVWESGTFFPVNAAGGEILQYVNRRLKDWSRADATRTELFYDDGAWTGWKDDFPVSGDADAAYLLYCVDNASVTINALSTGFLPMAVGPRMTLTSKDMIFAMVLVNERRSLPLALG